ncbi:hypothetical protein [Lentzea sp. NPDC051838]|uniref:hypothetical protein n=1 Tax=Lentzea sp. NPDC051838 TaxID=3154849 RepID=UPI003428709E
MSFARSAEPLFGDSDTYPLIEHIANQRSLVIYASAGVTIDRTGMSWLDMVEKLLREHKDNADGPDFGPPRATQCGFLRNETRPLGEAWTHVVPATAPQAASPAAGASGPVLAGVLARTRVQDPLGGLLTVRRR